MFDGRSSGDRQHLGRSPQQPRYRYLHGCGLMRTRNSLQHVARNSTRPQREPGNKSNSVALAVIHHVVPLTVGEAVAILHRNDGDDFARSLNVLLRDVGQPNQANLAFVSQLRQRFHGGLKRDDRIRSVELIDLDTVQAQSLEAALHRLAKMRRRSIMGPLIRPGTVPASLSSYY